MEAEILERLRQEIASHPDWRLSQRLATAALAYREIQEKCPRKHREVLVSLRTACSFGSAAFHAALKAQRETPDIFLQLQAGTMTVSDSGQLMPVAVSGDLSMAEQMLQWALEGYSFQQIVEKSGYHRETVSRALRKRGFKTTNMVRLRSRGVNQEEALQKFVAALTGCAATVALIDAARCRVDETLLSSMKESIGALQRLHSALRRRVCDDKERRESAEGVPAERETAVGPTEQDAGVRPGATEVPSRMGK